VTEISCFRCAAISKHRTRLSARTDEFALFGPETATDPPRYGMRVAVRTGMRVGVRVGVRVTVRVRVRVTVRVRVRVTVRVRVRVTVRVRVRVAVRVAVRALFRVAVRVAVRAVFRVAVRVAVWEGFRVAVRVAVGVGVATIHLAYRITFPAVLGKYGNVNVLPPSLADHPSKVSLDRVGGVGAAIGCPCNTTLVAIADPP
jgi:hypothetical protein